MDDTAHAMSDSASLPSLWARAVGAGRDPDAHALKELAGIYWYCAYAWWRRAGLDPVETATATLASFERWLGESPPGALDSGVARMRDWMLARLPELAERGVKLKGEPVMEIDRSWAENRYAEEPEGDPGSIFQRRWALTVIETAASTLRDEYTARGEKKLHAELLGFAGFEQADGDRYSSVAQRLGQTSGAIRKAVFEFRNRQREILHRLVHDTVLDPADADSEITALLCACDTTGPETSSAPLPSALQGQRPDEILVRAMRSVKMTHNGSGIWQPPTIAEASLLFPNYEITALVGRGGMGAVYRGRQVELDRPVAIKLLPLEVSIDRDFADRFRREARAMAKLNHPNIILIHEFGSTFEGHLFFVMEFVEGADLHQMIHGPGVTPEQSLSIISGVCDALAYAHGKGVVHRDIKPANVMVSVYGEVKVADFGLARLMDPGTEQMGHTMTGTVMGTPDYMAPEQMRGMNVDHRADIYSLGVMLYEMLCGEVPRGIFDPPSARVSGLCPSIDQVVIKAMQQQPDRRYQSTTEMKTDVAVAAGPRSVVHKAPKPVVAPRALAPPLKPAPKPAPKPARAAKSSTKKPLVIAAACLLPLLGFSAWVAKRKGNDSVPAVANKSVAVSPNAAASAAAPAAAAIQAPSPNTPSWIHPKLPPPNADGWITIFDGKDLRGVRISESELARNSVRRENDTLVVDRSLFTVPLTHTDVALRFTGRSESSTGFTCRVRSSSNVKREYYGCFFYGGSAGIARYNPYAKLKEVKVQNKFKEFFAGELRVVGSTQNLLVEGQTFASTTDNRTPNGDEIMISAEYGIAYFKRIEVKVLSTAPGNTAGTNQSSPTPPSGSSPAAIQVPVTKDAPFVNTLGMKFVPVPITGGSTDGKRVLFSIWETRVQDYSQFVTETKLTWPKPDFEQAPDHPAVNVSWDNAKAFCEWLTLRERAAGKIGPDEQYRLPSDHEWSCAVGIGEMEDPLKTPFEKSGKIANIYPWGTAWPPPENTGNFNSSFRDDGYPTTAPVGAFAVNPAGLYDMSVNVAEWCEDWWDKSKNLRVQRGHYWETSWNEPEAMLSSIRTSNAPSQVGINSGFRCVLASSAPAPSTAGKTATPPAPADSSAAKSVKSLSLFDGLTLTGWAINGDPAAFTVEDGAIKAAGAKGNLIYTGNGAAPAWTDFDLTMKVKTGDLANSGVWIHCSAKAAAEKAAALEVQILNDNKSSETQKTGSIYSIARIATLSAHNDQWFDYRIVVRGATITVWVDGVKINEWIQPANWVPPASVPNARLGKGTIGIQGYGGNTWFKDVRITLP